MCLRVDFLLWRWSNLETEIKWQTKHWTLVSDLLPLALILI